MHTPLWWTLSRAPAPRGQGLCLISRSMHWAGRRVEDQCLMNVTLRLEVSHDPLQSKLRAGTIIVGLGKGSLGDPTPSWPLQQLPSPWTALHSVWVASCLWDQERAWGRGRIGWWEEGASGIRCLSPARPGQDRTCHRGRESCFLAALVSGGNDWVPESRSRENAGGLAFPASWSASPGTGKRSGPRVGGTPAEVAS